MSNELIQRLIAVIARTQRIQEDKITIDSTFEELGMDSLEGVNLLFALEEEFNINIPDEEARDIRGVRQMAEGIEKLLVRSAAAAKETPRG
jgi:acyl carrier protein